MEKMPLLPRRTKDTENKKILICGQGRESNITRIHNSKVNRHFAHQEKKRKRCTEKSENRKERE
jgi:hypothetical protein